MYCGKCGRLLPGSAVACGQCGTRVDVIPPSAKPFQAGSAAPQRPVQQPRYQQPQPQYQQPRQPQSQYQQPQYRQPQYQQPQQAPAAAQSAAKPKKKTNPVVGILIIAAAIVLGSFAGKMIAGSYDTSEKQPAATQPAATQPAVNPAYERVFSDRGIVDMPVIFRGDVNYYVNVGENQIVDRQVFCHRDDLVIEHYETLWIPRDFMDDAGFNQLKQQYEVMLAGFPYSTLSTNTVMRDFYLVEIHITNMDNMECLRLAEDCGIMVFPDGVGFVSMSVTESDLLAQGYIKK